MTDIEILECEIEETKIELQQSIERTERLEKYLTYLEIKFEEMVLLNQSYSSAEKLKYLGYLPPGQVWHPRNDQHSLKKVFNILVI